MAINEERSYTEYNVVSPTTDFVVGFDFLDEGVDIVEITLNDIDPTTIGYTVLQVNNTTYRFAPPVPTGVVRLTRVTDIDQMANVFTEGAIFVSENMDGNFKQIRHSQQEVRDRFNKLQVDTESRLNRFESRVNTVEDSFDQLELDVQSAVDTANAASLVATNAASDVADTNLIVQSDGEIDVTLSGGEVVPNMNKRIADYGGKVVSVVGLDGVISTQDISDALELGSAAKRPVEDFVLRSESTSNIVEVVNTIADLSLTNKPKDGFLYRVKGFRAGSTDGGGVFVYRQYATETKVTGFIEPAKDNIGRFFRIINGPVNLLDGGSYRDGLAETNSFITETLQFAVNNNLPTYAPAGTYLLGGVVYPNLPNNSSLSLFGDGIDQTIFKERDGLTLTLGRFTKCIYLNALENTTIKSIDLRDFTIDKNGHTSMLTPAEVASDSYKLQQAHCLEIRSAWANSKIEMVNISNVKTTDKVGAGICFAAGNFDKVVIDNISGTNWQHNGGQRGDFEFQASIRDLVVENGVGKYAQCEPDITVPDTNYTYNAVFNNCNYESSEFTAYKNAPAAQYLELNNHTAMTKLTLRDCRAAVDGSTFKVSSTVSEFWSGLAKGSIAQDCSIIVGVDTIANATRPFYMRPSVTTNNPTYLKIVGGMIKPEGTSNPTTTGFAISSALYTTDSNLCNLELDGLEFDPSFERSVDCYANGKTTIKNCKLAARSSLAALRIGGYSTYKADVVLDSNDLSQLVGNYVEYLASNTLWSVNYKGVHDFAKAGFTSNNLPNTETCAKADGYFTSSIVPTVKGILGWRVKINKPVFGAGSEFICTTTHSVTPVYQLLNQAGVKMDTTANRPTGLTAASRGLRYLDTTLAAGGKPIQYNGSAWVDSLGAIV